jgi:hypothetical protein
MKPFQNRRDIHRDVLDLQLINVCLKQLALAIADSSTLRMRSAPFFGEAQCRQRMTYRLAADHIRNQTALLRRNACVLQFGSYLYSQAFLSPEWDRRCALAQIAQLVTHHVSDTNTGRC